MEQNSKKRDLDNNNPEEEINKKIKHYDELINSLHESITQFENMKTTEEGKLLEIKRNKEITECEEYVKSKLPGIMGNNIYILYSSLSSYNRSNLSYRSVRLIDGSEILSAYIKFSFAKFCLDGKKYFKVFFNTDDSNIEVPPGVNKTDVVISLSVYHLRIKYSNFNFEIYKSKFHQLMREIFGEISELVDTYYWNDKYENVNLSFLFNSHIDRYY